MATKSEIEEDIATKSEVEEVATTSIVVGKKKKSTNSNTYGADPHRHRVCGIAEGETCSHGSANSMLVSEGPSSDGKNHDVIEWTGVSSVQSAAGNYYLTGNISGQWSISQGQTVRICLNGKNWENFRISNSNGNGVLWITNCTGTPKISRSDNSYCFTTAKMCAIYGGGGRITVECGQFFASGSATPNGESKVIIGYGVDFRPRSDQTSHLMNLNNNNAPTSATNVNHRAYIAGCTIENWNTDGDFIFVSSGGPDNGKKSNLYINDTTMKNINFTETGKTFLVSFDGDVRLENVTIDTVKTSNNVVYTAWGGTTFVATNSITNFSSTSGSWRGFNCEQGKILFEENSCTTIKNISNVNQDFFVGGKGVTIQGNNTFENIAPGGGNFIYPSDGTNVSPVIIKGKNTFKTITMPTSDSYYFIGGAKVRLKADVTIEGENTFDGITAKQVIAVENSTLSIKGKNVFKNLTGDSDTINSTGSTQIKVEGNNTFNKITTGNSAFVFSTGGSTVLTIKGNNTFDTLTGAGFLYAANQTLVMEGDETGDGNIIKNIDKKTDNNPIINAKTLTMSGKNTIDTVKGTINNLFPINRNDMIWNMSGDTTFKNISVSGHLFHVNANNAQLNITGKLTMDTITTTTDWAVMGMGSVKPNDLNRGTENTNRVSLDLDELNINNITATDACFFSSTDMNSTLKVKATIGTISNVTAKKFIYTQGKTNNLGGKITLDNCNFSKELFYLYFNGAQGASDINFNADDTWDFLMKGGQFRHGFFNQANINFKGKTRFEGTTIAETVYIDTSGSTADIYNLQTVDCKHTSNGGALLRCYSNNLKFQEALEIINITRSNAANQLLVSGTSAKIQILGKKDKKVRILNNKGFTKSPIAFTCQNTEVYLQHFIMKGNTQTTSFTQGCLIESESAAIRFYNVDLSDNIVGQSLVYTNMKLIYFGGTSYIRNNKYSLVSDSAKSFINLSNYGGTSGIKFLDLTDDPDIKNETYIEGNWTEFSTSNFIATGSGKLEATNHNVVIKNNIMRGGVTTQTGHRAFIYNTNTTPILLTGTSSFEFVSNHYDMKNIDNQVPYISGLYIRSGCYISVANGYIKVASNSCINVNNNLKKSFGDNFIQVMSFYQGAIIRQESGTKIDLDNTYVEGIMVSIYNRLYYIGARNHI